MKLIKNKKGILGNLGGIFQQLAFLGIFGAIMLVVLSSLKDTITRGSLGNNASHDALSNTTLGIGNVFAQFPLFGTILGLLLIVGVVFLLVRGGDKSSVL